MRPFLRSSIGKILLPPAFVGVSVVGVWYLFAYVFLEPSSRWLLPPPHQVVTEGFGQWEHASRMLDGTLATAKVAVIGLVIAAVIGIVFAVTMSQSAILERGLFPFAVVLQAIPILAIVPLIGFWFGYGLSARVVVCVLIAVFPIIVNTLFGLQSADRGLHDLFTLSGAGRSLRLRRLMFPSSLPAMFAGLRISAGLSVVGAIVGDFYFGRGEAGIGQLLRVYASRLMGPQLFAAVIVSSLLGVAVFTFFGWMATRVVGRWNGTAR